MTAQTTPTADVMTRTQKLVNYMFAAGEDANNEEERRYGTTTYEELREDYAELQRKEEEKERERMIETAKKDIEELRESLQPYGEDED